jgi:hypothetical protein
MVPLVSVSAAQDVKTTNSAIPGDQYEKKTYLDQNGTQVLPRTVETEHRTTSYGEVDIQRYSSPAYPGDDKARWEREVRTRKLPDGSVEKEYVVRFPDGAGQLAPIQIIREKTTPGPDSTVVQRETLQQVGGEDWQAVQRENITEKGSDNAKQVFKEVQQPDTSHEWQTVGREASSTSTSKVGDTTQKEMQSVRQTPNAYGRLSDVERRQERSVVSGGKDTQEKTVYGRDMSTSDPDSFILLDHSVSQVKTVAPGTTTRDAVRESDLLFGYAGSTPHSEPEVVEKQSVVETVAPDGSKQIVTTVNGRTAVDPIVIRPMYTVVVTSDSAGYVRQIFIPADQ